MYTKMIKEGSKSGKIFVKRKHWFHKSNNRFHSKRAHLVLSYILIEVTFSNLKIHWADEWRTRSLSQVGARSCPRYWWGWRAGRELRPRSASSTSWRLRRTRSPADPGKTYSIICYQCSGRISLYRLFWILLWFWSWIKVFISSPENLPMYHVNIKISIYNHSAA